MIVTRAVSVQYRVKRTIKIKRLPVSSGKYEITKFWRLFVWLFLDLPVTFSIWRIIECRRWKLSQLILLTCHSQLRSIRQYDYDNMIACDNMDTIISDFMFSPYPVISYMVQPGTTPFNWPYELHFCRLSAHDIVSCQYRMVMLAPPSFYNISSEETKLQSVNYY